MSYCEDYPCCGHGPPPLGDGGGCPDESGCFDCVLCGSKMPRHAPSAICADCRSNPRIMHDNENCPGCGICEPDDECDDYRASDDDDESEEE